MPGTASIVVLTGSGISADSGVATFRDAGGLWENQRVEDVATPEAWRRDPAGVWRFYQGRRAKLRGVEPNAAHLALAELERGCAAAGTPFLLVTQNVDDLHERAGSSRLLHMHGELAKLRCEACAHSLHDLDSLDPDRFRPCPACGHARMRPDVVWFGEIPHGLDLIDREVSLCTHFLALGTSGVVYPAAAFLSLARSAGAHTLVNSLDPPDNLHPTDTFHPGRAAEVVPALIDELRAAIRDS